MVGSGDGGGVLPGGGGRFGAGEGTRADAVGAEATLRRAWFQNYDSETRIFLVKLRES